MGRDPVETHFVYDGDALVLELSPNGQPLVQYVWGLLGPVARVDLQNGSNTRYYVLDARGHARALVDSSGTVTDYYEYDAWGNVLPGSFGSTSNPFKWNAAAGYQHIPFTGLYHVGAREYDPRTARWLQRDPIGQSSGDPNLYRYCGNDAVNLNDPSGTDPPDLGGRLSGKPIRTLVFTGTMLKIYAPSGQLLAMMPAYSGLPGASSRDQGIRNAGPIPAGEYFIEPDSVQTATLNPFKAFSSDRYYFGNLAGNDSWGERRAALTPSPSTNVLGRTGFFIHGGRWVGSAGCIDVGPNDVPLLDAIGQQRELVRVIVEYPFSFTVPYNLFDDQHRMPWKPEFRPAFQDSSYLEWQYGR